MLRHFINGTMVDEPHGWGEFTEDIERSYKSRIIGYKYPVDITFVGSGYELLREIFDENECADATYLVQEECDDVYTTCLQGTIVLADIEWNLSKCSAEVSLTDDGIGARINSNKNLVVYPGADVSKNGEIITACPSLALQVFNPGSALNTYDGTTRKAYDWFDAITHVVAFITDEAATVVSDWYDALPDAERYALIDGHELRVGTGTKSQAKWTWDQVFYEMAKKYNLWVAVERDTDSSVILRIEPEEYFWGTSQPFSFPDTDDLLESKNTDLLFAKVLLGSEDYTKELGNTFALPWLILRGFTKEDVNLSGVCNTDEELDTVSKWIIDSNNIERVVVNNSTEFEEDIFIIQYDQSTNKAVKADIIDPGNGPYTYNEQLMNINVLYRYSLPFDPIIITEDSSQSAFLAEYTIGPGYAHTETDPVLYSLSPLSLGQLQFDNDYTAPNFDAGNNYGNGTTQGNPVSQADSRFTADAQGFYGFRVLINWSIVSNNEYSTFGGIWVGHRMTANIRLYVQTYNASNVITAPPAYFVGTVSAVSAVGNYTETFDFGANLQATDYVVVRAEIFYNDQTFAASSGFGTPPHSITTRINFATWETMYVAQGGGTIIEVDPKAYYSTVYKFERGCILANWQTLKADLSSRIGVSTDERLFKGYVQKASRNIKTGKTKWELIANKLP